MQRSVLAGLGPPGWLQGSHLSRPGQAASLSTPQTAGITACLLCFQDPPHPNYFVFLSCFPFPISSFFSSSPASQALRTDPLQDRLSILPKDETYLSPASSWGCAKTGFTFISPGASSGLLGRSRTAGRRPTSRGDPVVWTLPVPTRPRGFGLQRTLRLDLVASSLCPLGKSLIPLKGKLSSRSHCRITKCALGADFALDFRQLQQAKQTQEWRLGCAPPGSSAYASKVAAVTGVLTREPWHAPNKPRCALQLWHVEI